jgi:YfdX protein
MENTKRLFQRNGSGALLLMAVSMSLVSIDFCGQIPANSAETTTTHKASKTDIKKHTLQRTLNKRKEIVEEAVSSIRETQDALKQLEQGKSKEAQASIERATGKLEILLARDPNVSLVPIDVRILTEDVSGDLNSIKNAREEAARNLKDGRVQEARALLDDLVSESVISTTSLPLATYPTALKSAAKLIDENKLNDAKETLQTALDALEVSEAVIPLPILRSAIVLDKADDLVKITKRTPEQNKELAELITAADEEIKVAEVLGYGTQPDFVSFHKEMAELRDKTSNGKSGTGFFDQIKISVDSMTKNSQRQVASK